ncbi:MAG: bifunctional UDP-N-acetylglucosamine diphosphorylase/glucosamine-1-phosphate N-acetyltransferase GlmU [Deltaproteobacteria bacterium]|nr:bifunctional UDP-N-acetylglucosamine diphosphorylase/glucosamine-1-phosphate N-acetyltransferase GlmU [Deltaproteobacteria bacterium]MBW2448255.1 bifunctional UDP-N-acetylglucosamine diphosphorylase/glucosamine-1-phosphate N-acetyltransferase GlmU [Deltaproteobacteria bacterium]
MGTSAANPELDVSVVILAAGQGTRMKSNRSKVLHEICGQPMLGFPLALARELSPREPVVVVGRDAEEVERAFAGEARFVLQAEQNGTGHAVLAAQEALADARDGILVLYGDTPLLRLESLRRMAEIYRAEKADLVMLTSPEPLPGVVVRDAEGRIERIVELTDATPEEAKIREGNTGVYLVNPEVLWKGLAQVDDRNEQGEIYLTDVVAYAVGQGHRVEGLALEDADDCLGVNTRGELAAAAGVARRRACEALMAEGVTIVDPANTYLDVGVRIGRDSLIEPGCVVTGGTVLGEGCHVKPHCTIEDSRVGNGAVLGPSAHLRPGCVLGENVRIGNYVEVKNSNLADGVKADHLAYVGDADVGEGSSFGCGAITVNYDWETKSRTTVGRDVKIGCNVNLIAPVEIEDGAVVAAGSTITSDVPGEALAVARARQKNIEGWRARRREQE